MGLHESSIPCPPGSVWHYFLCHYLPVTAGIDPPSRSLLKFKRAAQPDLDGWIDCALLALREMEPPLSPDTIIVRALGHQETSIHTPPLQTSLDLLGQAIATQFHCRYFPYLLIKTRPTRPNKGLTVEQRNAELQDVYSVAAQTTSTTLPAQTTSTTPVDPTPAIWAAPTPPPFLLIDDLLTTGATARTIISALRLQFPARPIRVFTLGKVTQEAGLNHRSPLVGTIYRLEGTAGWKQSC
jgi:ATP-dependent DNA helicase RecQ